jgi:hypothetical protein
MAECGKGWTERCAHAKSAKCTCRCGGENHGKARPVIEGGKERADVSEVLQLADLAIAPRVIERFDYTGFFGKRATTHLTVCGKVVIATERDDNPGASITNAAESLWAKVREQFGDDIIAIEHYPERGTHFDPIKESWDIVETHTGSAKWVRASREVVADLIAGRLVPALVAVA